MKTQSDKKKTHNQEAITVEDKNIPDTPKNLLPENIENQDISLPAKDATKEETKIVDGQKENLQINENKSAEIKSDDVILAAETASIPPPDKPPETTSSSPPIAPPPISVSVSNIDTSQLSSNKSNRKFLGIGLVVLVAFLLLGSTWYLFSRSPEKMPKKCEPVILVSPTTGNILPTQTASEEVKPDKYPIKVLNGSGITGEATNMKEILEAEGFEVSETGNADNFDYTETIVQTKKGVEKSFLEKLKALINKTYMSGEDELVAASESSEVIVIVGSKKAE